MADTSPKNPTPETTKAVALTFEERVKAVEEGYKRLCIEHGVELETKIDFPRYRELPVAAQLAMVLMEEHGSTIIRQYRDVSGADQVAKDKA